MISALRWASDVSHFNVSLIEQGKVTRQCPLITMFEEKGEPKPGVEPASVRLPTERLFLLAKRAYLITNVGGFGFDSPSGTLDFLI